LSQTDRVVKAVVSLEVSDDNVFNTGECYTGCADYCSVSARYGNVKCIRTTTTIENITGVESSSVCCQAIGADC
jgi:hypothetical protein